EVMSGLTGLPAHRHGGTKPRRHRDQRTPTGGPEA
ncbi:SURF1 family protein, partial [Burkholderia multivorans]